MKKIFLSTGVLIVLLMAQSSYSALSIDEYLNQAKTKNPMFKSYDLSIEATQDKMISADMDLSPVVTAGYLKSKDKSLPSAVALGERSLDQYSMGLAKKFSTGTAVRIDAQTNDFKNESPLVPSLDQFSTGSLGITVSQSLWKDFLGAGTRNKIERQRVSTKIEMTAAELQRRGFLIQLENDFWDYAVAIEDLKLKKSNLERAQKMESWTAKRVSNGISDQSDLLNIKALSALRSLQFQTAEEELKSQKNKFRENLGLTEGEINPEIKADLTHERTYIKDLMNKKNIVSLDSEISKYESETKSYVSDEVKDNLRPDLSVFGSYQTTAFQRDHTDTVSKITATDYPKLAMGVNLNWILETDSKSGLRDSAMKESMASRLKFEKKRALSNKDWQELLRKYELTQKNIKLLEQIAIFQRDRSKKEQDKFLQGRTVTATVVTAETEAAEAEVTLLKAKAGLKKLEASGLLFTSLD